MRHTDLATTQRYIGLGANALRDAINLLDDTLTGAPEGGPGCGLTPEAATPRGPAGKLLTARLCLELSPPMDFGRTSPKPYACSDVNIPVVSSSIDILAIELLNSDPEIACELLLFVREPPQDPSEWGTARMWSSGTVQSPFTTFKFAEGLSYRDLTGGGTIHAGLKLGQRPLLLDLPQDEGSKEARSYYRRPITLDITVKYRPA